MTVCVIYTLYIHSFPSFSGSQETDGVYPIYIWQKATAIPWTGHQPTTGPHGEKTATQTQIHSER